MRLVIFLMTFFLCFGSANSAEVEKYSPKEVAGATTVDAVKAKALFDRGATFVDVRSNQDWEAGRIPGAVHLELKKVFSEETLSQALSKEAEAVIYCNGHSCLRSSVAILKAVGWGFSKIYYFRDGYPAWRLARYPLE